MSDMGGRKRYSVDRWEASIAVSCPLIYAEDEGQLSLDEKMSKFDWRPGANREDVEGRTVMERIGKTET